MSQDMKICSNCKHYHPAYTKDSTSLEYTLKLKDTCRHKEALKSISVVNGSKTYATCEELRGNYGKCGTEAKYYEEVVKYCKDCKYYRLSFIDKLLVGYDSAKCIHPISAEMSPSLVTSKVNYSTCCSFRTNYKTIDTCGIEAKYYEPKN